MAPEKKEPPQRLGMTNYGNGEGAMPQPDSEDAPAEVGIPDEVWAEMSMGLFKATWDKYIDALETNNATMQSLVENVKALRAEVAEVKAMVEAMKEAA